MSTSSNLLVLKGAVREWRHSPAEGCWVEIAVGGAVIKVNATPALVEAMRSRATIKVTFEVEVQPTAPPCPCCGPLS